MKTKLSNLIICLFLIHGGTYVSAQVTIGANDEPVKGALLQLKSVADENSNGNVNATQGLAFPRVELTSLHDLYPMYLNDADYLDPAKKAKLDLTHKGLMAYNVGTSFMEGMYYWDGTTWNMVREVEPWMVSGSTKLATLNTQNIYQTGQVTIGSDADANPTAILNLVSDSKGILLPRVALKNHTDIVTIPNPTTGLLVYNKGTEDTFKTIGFMYWDGNEWKLFNSSTSTPPTVTELLCGGATLSPSVYYAGQPYKGIMKLPYTGGNGGSYTGGIVYTTNGLNFRLQDGALEVGSGELIFNVEGTPTLGSPVITTIPVNSSLVPFYTGSCEAKVGDQMTADIKQIAVMGPLTYTTEGKPGYATSITTPDGLFSLRAYVMAGATFFYTNIQIRANKASGDTISGNYAYLWSGAGGSQSNRMTLASGEWSGDQFVSSADFLTATKQSALTSRVYLGQPDVYEGNTPEQRIYAFTPYDPNRKVFYNFRFTMGSQDPTKTANSTNCPGGACPTKVYLYIEQITAP